jgi:hypothetical protein
MFLLWPGLRALMFYVQHYPGHRPSRFLNSQAELLVSRLAEFSNWPHFLLLVIKLVLYALFPLLPALPTLHFHVRHYPGQYPPVSKFPSRAVNFKTGRIL